MYELTSNDITPCYHCCLIIYLQYLVQNYKNVEKSNVYVIFDVTKTVEHNL